MLRDYEARLLRSYQHFVDYLLRLSLRVDPLRNTATQCAQTLLVARPNFNFRVSLVRLLIRSCDDRDVKIRELGKNGPLSFPIREFNSFFFCLFSSLLVEVLLRCSRRTCALSARPRLSAQFPTTPSRRGSASTRKYVPPLPPLSVDLSCQVLAPLEALTLTAPLSAGHDVLRGITPKKDRKHLSKTERKNMKANKALVKELEENEAETQRRKVREGHTDMLKARLPRLFELLFILLDHLFAIFSNSPQERAIAVTAHRFSWSRQVRCFIAFTARFLHHSPVDRVAHLVNVALLSDLLSALKTLMKNAELSLLAKLHCARTAFYALKLQGASPRLPFEFLLIYSCRTNARG